MSNDRQRRRDEYSAKLRDPRWQKMRLEILNRDKWECQICLDKESTLHVHHRWYESGKEPWEADPAALVTLCESCHDSETTNRAEAERWLLAALKRVLFAHDLCQLEKLMLSMRFTHVEEVQLCALASFMSIPTNVETVLKAYFDEKCPHPRGWPDLSIRPRPEIDADWNGFTS